MIPEKYLTPCRQAMPYSIAQRGGLLQAFDVAQSQGWRQQGSLVRRASLPQNCPSSARQTIADCVSM